MKKLFTLLVAIAFTTMAFAQLPVMPMPEGVAVNNEQLRTDWYGWSTWDGNFGLPAGSGYALRVPADAIQAGTVIEKVAFVHFHPADHWGAGYETYTNDEYTISIYQGGSWTYDPNATPTQTANEGTLVSSMVYSAAGASEGRQEVTLTNPYTVVAGTEFWVAITVTNDGVAALTGDHSAEEAAHFGESLLNMASDPGWWQYIFGQVDEENPDATIYTFQPFYLSIYANDGVAYVPKCDWYVEMYDPNDINSSPTEVNEVHLDAHYTDSLCFYGGSYNGGTDPAIGTVTWTLTCDQLPEVTDLFNGELSQTWPSATDPTDTQLDAGYGYRFGDPNNNRIAIFSMPNDDTPIEQTDFGTYNLQWPLELCFHVEWVSTDGSVDPNLDNNDWCVNYYNDLGVNEMTVNGVNVFPNPANNVINVENAAGSQISLFNITGQEVLSIEVANANAAINVADLAEGIYVVRVNNNGKVATSKISIVR